MGAVPHLMIVETPYYQHIAAELMKGATEAIKEAQATFQRFSVPGAFEIPAAIKFAFRASELDTARSPVKVH